MPSMIEDVVRDFAEVDEFQITLEKREELDTLVIQLEPGAGLEQLDLRDRFGAEVKRRLGLTPVVTVVPPGTLPRFEMKAKRFRDLTQQPTPA